VQTDSDKQNFRLSRGSKKVSYCRISEITRSVHTVSAEVKKNMTDLNYLSRLISWTIFPSEGSLSHL
jgi:hypothetical protein